MGLCARVGLVREKVLLMHLEVGFMLFREEGLARGSAFFLSPQRFVDLQMVLFSMQLVGFRKALFCDK